MVTSPPPVLAKDYPSRDIATPTALTIREIPSEERPRERLRQYGSGQLSNAELIAILFRTGLEGENAVAMAMRILSHSGGLSGLARVTYQELCAQKGISDAKACQLLAALELGRRVSALAPDDKASGSSPAELARLLTPELAHLDRECVKIVLLDAKNKVVAVEALYTGNVSSVTVRPAEVFATALRRNCPSIAMVHNHPSGDPTPSRDDIALTRRLRDSGKLLDVELLDHIVIAQGAYVSMREKGLGFD